MSFQQFDAEYGKRDKSGKLRFWVGTTLFLLVAGIAARFGRIDPLAFIRDFPHITDYVRDCLPHIALGSFGADLADWYWGLNRWLMALVDTVFIAVISTIASSAFAFALSFCASKNLSPPWLYWLTRRFFELCRGIPELLYALLFVQAFGLGALPGVLAITVHSIGSLGKLFAEVNENAAMGEWEGVKAAGGGWFERIRYGIVPQVLPNFASYALLRFEINIRAATVIGFVGAGGIGMHLMTAIRSFQYKDISAIVLMLIVVVFIIDKGCENIRFRLIGTEAAK